ncbi:MAG: hypothetical protein ACTSYG_07330 [Candidatus Heimdallarchaeota archaeon]
MSYKQKTILLLLIMCLSVVSAKGIAERKGAEQTPVDRNVLPPVVDDESTITTNDWQQGETVKVKFSRENVLTDVSKMTVIAYDDYYRAQNFAGVKDISYLAKNDNKKAIFMFDDSQERDILYAYVDLFFEIKTEATLKYELFASLNYVSQFTSIISGTFDLSTQYIDGTGFANVQLYAYADLTDLYLYIYAFNFETGVKTEINHATKTFASTAVDSLQIRADQLFCVLDDVSHNIRSEFQYSSEMTILHRLFIDNYDYLTTITIYKPKNWEFLSVEPECDVSSTTNIVLTNTIPLTYEIFFLSNCSNILAIKDVSSSYFEDVDFENGRYFSDWTSSFTTTNAVYNNSFAGVSSLFLTASASAVLETTFALEQEYYFSFAYYLESGTITVATADYSETLTTTDRWETVFFSSQTTYLRFTSSSCQAYIDNVRIFLPAVEISTIDLNKYQVDLTFIFWDGYQNVPATNELVFSRILDRTYPRKTLYTIATREESFYKKGITDSSGVFTYILNETLEQKEYELLTYAKNSWWGCCSWTQTNLSQSGFYGDSSYGSTTKTIENGYVKFTTTHKSSHTLEYYYVQIGNGALDGTQDVFIFDWKSSSNSDWEDFILKKAWYSDVTVFEPENFDFTDIDDDNIVSSSNWLVADLWIDTTQSVYAKENRYDDFVSRHDWTGDFANVYQLHFSVDNTTAAATDFYLRNIHSTVSVKHYFTPSVTNYVDFAAKELTDEWDFTEDDENIDGIWTTTSINRTSNENGFFAASGKTTKAYFDLGFDELAIDSSYYNYLEIRVKTNSSATDWQLYGVRDDSGYIAQTYFDDDYDFGTTWKVLVVDLSTAGGWGGTETTITFVFTRSDYPTNFQSNEFVFIDYVRLVHEESSSYVATDTLIYIMSENNNFTDAVYLDKTLLGLHNEIFTQYKTLTVGTHNITWQPIARQNVKDAFLPATATTYTYSVSAAGNYYLAIRVDIDAAGGLLYTTIRTDWGNCTYRVKDNSTWLGSAIDEGNAIWSFNKNDYGLHNFTIEVYQGASVWDTITTSITIVAPSLDDNYLTGLNVDVDAASGILYTLITTNWGNCTYRVKDNSTWLGSAIDEGAASWSFNQNVYGLHVFTIEIYNGATTWMSFNTSITIVQPSAESNYYTAVYLSIDAAAGQLYTTITTSWANQTIVVYDNNSLIGSSAEGSTVFTFALVEGYHNFSIKIFNGATLWDTIFYGINIVADLKDARIVYFDTFQNVLEFERFKTFVNTSRYGYYQELDSYVRMTEDENITISTYNKDDVLLATGMYNYSEVINVELKVHFVQWMNTNITADVLVSIAWSFEPYPLEFDNYLIFTLSQGMISEAVMIYADAFYKISYHAPGYRDSVLNTTLIPGYKLAHYTIPIKLTPKTSLATMFMNFLSILSSLLSPVLLIFAIRSYQKKDEQTFWIVAGAGLILGIIALSLQGTIVMTTMRWLAILAFGLILLVTFINYKKRRSVKNE